MEFLTINVKNEIERYELLIKIERLKKMRDEFLNIEYESLQISHLPEPIVHKKIHQITDYVFFLNTSHKTKN